MSVESFDSSTLIDEKYQLVELIGVGGIGQVWKAKDIRLEHRLVAIKFIEWRSDDDREMREMHALARLDHPNIVHLIEFGKTSNGTPYLVMNFVPDGSLQERLDKGKLDAATRDRVLKELCDALDYIHSQNVVHRDLKPANILFDALDHVRIGDFGLAKLVDTTYVASIFGGTRRFQAPEQSAQAIAATLDRGEMPTIDHRVDIYALGVIAWLLFTGQYPDDPLSPSSDWLSPNLEQVLRKAIAHHRKDRYNSAGEFWQALTSAASRGQRLSITPGTMINDKYQLVEQIGEGGMGQVWKAKDTKHGNRPVAIKFIARDKYGDDPKKRARFWQEMQALARLDHANIVHLIEFDETPDNTSYLVMNFIPGGSLHERFNKGKLDVATRDRVLKELCDALDYIHSQNVVHRDLKPANILFDALDHVRIGDFGLAKLVDTTHVASIFGGTPHFQAPEQSAQAIAATLDQDERRTIDHRADIYALGVIAWLLFTGQYPDDPPSPSSDWLSPNLEQVLRKAIAHHRKDRYNSAGEFWQALTSATSRKQKLPMWAWGIAGGVILFLAVAGVWLMRPDLWPTPEPSPATVPPISTDIPTPVSPTAIPQSADVSLTHPTSTPSVTPSSVPSPMPTATPTPFLTVIEGQVNIYDGPGPEYNVLRKVNRGDKLPILGRSENGVWLCVDYFGWKSWIPAQSITTNADIQTLPVFTPPPTPVIRPPVIEEIDVPATSIKACSAISVTGIASDQSDGELTYTWEASAGFIAGEGDSVTYNVPKTVGSQTITVTVQDEVGMETSDSIQVRIVSASPPLGTSKPAGVFGQVWQECEIRRKLGWATGEDTATSGTQQYFDQGMMFWRKDADQIYVLMLDGNWYVYQDTWEESPDVYSCASDIVPRNTPPTPLRGFGKVWCDQLGGPNAAIGWAQHDEQGYQAHWQSFEHGLMGEGYDKYIYVFYVNEDGNPSWHSYPSFASTNSSNSDTTSQRIRIGDRAWVCTTYESLVMRAGPGIDSSEITRLEPGVYVTVIDGPSYAGGRLWWKVRTDSGRVGWVAEGGDDIDPYYICPEG